MYIGKFNNEETLKLYEEEFREEILKFDEIESAKKFMADVGNYLSSQQLSKVISPSLLPRYENLITKHQLVLLSLLPKITVLELLRKNLAIALGFGETFELERKINARLVSIPVYEERDIFKRQIRQAIQNNEEFITDELGQGGKKTIKDWVNDYLSHVGPDPVSDLEMNDYFAKDKDFQRLSDDKRQKIRRLISFFESMKLSSLTPEGLENSIPIISESGATKVYRRGVVEDIPKDIISKYKGSVPSVVGAIDYSDDAVESQKLTLQDPHVQVKAAYQGAPVRQEKIVAQASKYAQKFDGNLEGLRREFYKAVQNQNEIKTIAAFRVLADLNDLGAFLAEDEQLHKFLVSVWQKKYGDGLVAEFNQNSNQPKFVKLFLRYILMERLNMSEHDAGRVGINIANIYKKNEVTGYERIAYFDAKANEFKFFED